MQLSIGDETYSRLCQLARERNTKPAPMVKLWIEARVLLLWDERGKADVDAPTAPLPVKPRYKGRIRKVG